LRPGNGGSAPAPDPLATAAAALDVEAARVEEGAAAPGAPIEAPPAPVDRAAEATDLVEFCSTLLFPLWPRLEQVYLPAVRARLAGAAVPLMAKYDFSLADFFKAWMPEIGFAMVAVPLVTPTLQAIRADRLERKAIEAATVKPAAAGAAAPDPSPVASAAIAADMLARAAAPA
jgi:hypothetical protein